MAKAFDPKRQHGRERIAHLAAKLMAEDGIEDFAMAKRKAARQLGIVDASCLPGNAEIESALRQYHAIYQEDEQRERIAALRRQALAEMRRLERFDPHLIGPVLAGTAVRHAAVELILFADSDKEVELFLLGQGIAYKRGERRFRFVDTYRPVPLFILGGDPALVEVAVLAPEFLRLPPRSAVDGRAMAWARPHQVECLVTGSIQA